MQTLVRSMPDLHKTLILANPRRRRNNDTTEIVIEVDDAAWVVEELAMATEHAPFRHRNKSLLAEASSDARMVGAQHKRQKMEPNDK
jgi:hypothetical protein